MIYQVYSGLISFFYDVPIWVSGLWVIVVLLVSIELGFRLGLRQQETWANAPSGGGNLVLTAMFALLGLTLAFTYNAGASRYDNRKQVVIIEANALGTVFLRANLVDEPGRTELKRATLDYARSRVSRDSGFITTKQQQRRIEESVRMLDRLWPITEQIIKQREPGPIELFLAAAVNTVIDVHAARVAGIMDRLPATVLWLLTFIAAASLAVAGFNAGLSGRISRGRMTTFATVLATVMLVIMDFDRPTDGLIQIGQESIYQVIEVMEKDLGL
jgi:hypothetical protein